MPAPSLVLDGVSAGYQGAQVLKRLSLEVAAGTLVTIIGPNGHGKTTLLRCVSGLVRATEGTIRFGEATLSRLSPDRVVAAGVVHIPQGDLLFPDMSVRDNLLMGAYLPAAYAVSRQKLAEVYRLLPTLAERQHQVASTLSGGERRMLAIGRGLMAEGRILLIDEPSLGLAPLAVRLLMEVVDRLRSAGTSVLLVEQDVAVALRHADRGYVMETGRIVLEDTAQALLNSPRVREAYLGLGG
jgi:branched-chain amino acid transport system ATP-binding protein